MKIEINFVEHNKQRYNTCGDWQFDYKTRTLFITVSKTHVDSFDFLIAIHELIEGFMCVRDKVSQELVDAFDTGIGKDLDEPGDDIRAPYYKQHGIASGIERTLAAVLNVDWPFFGERLKNMGEEYNPTPKDSAVNPEKVP